LGSTGHFHFQDLLFVEPRPDDDPDSRPEQRVAQTGDDFLHLRFGQKVFGQTVFGPTVFGQTVFGPTVFGTNGFWDKQFLDN
jgi:hypothetical protein